DWSSDVCSSDLIVLFKSTRYLNVFFANSGIAGAWTVFRRVSPTFPTRLQAGVFGFECASAFACVFAFGLAFGGDPSPGAGVLSRYSQRSAIKHVGHNGTRALHTYRPCKINQ